MMSGDTWGLLLLAVVSFATGVVWTLVAQTVKARRRRQRVQRAGLVPYPVVRLRDERDEYRVRATRCQVCAEKAAQTGWEGFDGD